MYGDEFFHGWGNMFFGPLVIIALVFILFVIWAKDRTGPSRNGISRGNENTTGDPRKILDQRFARGELDEAEYLRKRAMLETHQH